VKLATAVLLTAVALASAVGANNKVILPATVLGDLPGVGLHTEHLQADAIKLGLAEEAVQRRAELVLRKSAIPVLSEDERRSAPGRPYLFLKVSVVGDAFPIRVALSEIVGALRRTAIGSGITWYRDATGTHGSSSEFALEGLEKQVELFARAWRFQRCGG
jgi:hypothetical protein